jgi:YfiR/HmsC-like
MTPTSHAGFAPSSVRRHWRAAFAFALAICGISAASAAPDAVERREAQFKAAYLFNFVKFVDWPSNATDVLTVCFVGGNSVFDALSEGIDAKRIGNRQLAVRRLDANASATGCNAIYLDESAGTEISSVIAAKEAPILTISDTKAFTAKGGMIELFTDSNRLRFNINVDAANKAGLRISSSLLQLAATVKRGES